MNALSNEAEHLLAQAQQKLTADARAEVSRLDAKVHELEDLTRRQALFITKLVMESRGHSFAAEVTQLRAGLREAVEIAYRRGRGDQGPMDADKLAELWKQVEQCGR